MLAGFLMGVQAVAQSALAPHRRTRWTRRPLTRFLHALARRACLLAGLILAALASRTFAAVLAAGLIAASARRSWVRTARHRKGLLREAFVALCKRDPGTPREELLAVLLRARHPDWDPEMIGMMIRDHPKVEDLFDSLVRLEKRLDG